MRTLPGRVRLAGSRASSASLAPLQLIQITEDPPAEAFQEAGLQATPCDQDPEKIIFVESPAEKYQMFPSAQASVATRRRKSGARA